LKNYFRHILVILFIWNIDLSHAQKVNEFPQKTDPLHVKVEMFDQLMLGNHWNEGAIMQYVIFPPAGLDRPIIGPQADCLDPTSEMLAAYSHKYAITKDPNDRKIANQIFEAIVKFEKVTGVPGWWREVLIKLPNHFGMRKYSGITSGINHPQCRDIAGWEI
jgi:hypothetical protein